MEKTTKNIKQNKTKGDFAVSSRSYESPPEIFYDLIKHNKSPDSKAQVLEICRVKILCVITIPPFFPCLFSSYLTFPRALPMP